MRRAAPPIARTLRRVLVATDFSAGAGTALSRLRYLPLAPRAEITFLHVLPTTLGPALRAREAAEAERRLRAAATQLGRELRAAGMKQIRVRTALAHGRPYVEILRRAGSTDLVVVGRHGHRPFPGLLVGSTAERIVRNGEVPVLLAAQRARTPYRRPIAAVDLSDTARATLELAVRVVAPADRLLDVVHVYETPHAQLLRGVAKASARARYHRECREQARDAVTELIAESAAVTVVRRVVLRRGDPRQAILAASRVRRADLVALGTHGRSGLPHLLLGSVAEAVMRHAGCDVLVVPRQRPARRSAGRAA